jgi:hypothetical protein
VVKIQEFFLRAKDIKVLRKRAEWLDSRLASRDVNAPGTSYDRDERGTLRFVLSQVEANGVEHDPRPPRVLQEL